MQVGFLPALVQQQLARITETMPRFFEWARITVEPLIEQHLGLEIELDHLRALVLEQLPSPQTVAQRLGAPAQE